MRLNLLHRVSVLFLIFFSLIPLEAKGRAYVLCYHSFLGNPEYNTDFSSKEVREQIQFFKSRGFHFVTFQDIVSGKIEGNKNILVTVDDGNKSFLYAYRGAFIPEGIHPMLEIIPSFIGTKRWAFTWEQLEELKKQGLEIGSHSYTHPTLDDALLKRSSKRFHDEFTESKSLLQQKLGINVRVFVFPYGRYNDEALQAAKASGYQYALTLRKGYMSSPPPVGQDAYLIPRYILTRKSWQWKFDAIVRDAELADQADRSKGEKTRSDG